MDLCLVHGTFCAFIKSHDSFKHHHLLAPKSVAVLPCYRTRRINLRRKLAVVATSASGSCRYGSSLNTPHEPRSSPGKFLSSVFQNQRQLFHVAVSEQLHQLVLDRDGAIARMYLTSTSSESYLHRRIAELKEHECRNAVEDVMYMLIIYNFSDIRVPLVPTLSKCIYNGRLEIWPSKDWELESIHGYQVLDLVREHISSITGLKAKASVAEEWATTGISKIHLCRIYTMSIFFGYLLKSASVRHYLEATLSIPLQGAIAPLGFGDFRRYVRRFDDEMMERCARLRSKEAFDLVEKHSRAMFGDNRDDALEEDDKMILTSFSSLKRLVLEAVAFGSFLWDAEEYVDRVYKLAIN